MTFAAIFDCGRELASPGRETRAALSELPGPLWPVPTGQTLKGRGDHSNSAPPRHGSELTGSSYRRGGG